MDGYSLKRQYNYDSISNAETKKLRRSSDRSDSTITNFEHLPNEIFYEICDYLDPDDSCNAFSQLNSRFHNLVISSSLPLKIKLSHKSKSTMEHRCRNVIIPNRHRIISITVDGYSVINNFFSYCNIDSSFSHLESITLIGVPETKLFVILFYLGTLPRLISLTILLEDDSYYNINDIYKIIFRLPHLKYSKLSLPDLEESDISIPISINEKFSTIERLILNFPCNINELSSIISHTPHLQYLKCSNLIGMNDDVKKEIPLNLSKLTNISFVECGTDFNELEYFMRKICSNLQTCRLSTCGDPAFLDADRWKRLIKRHMPYLREFHFDHEVPDFLNEDTPKHEHTNQFTTKFWLERQWYFGFKDESGQYTYSIHPYRRQWFDYHEYERNGIYLDGNISRYISSSAQSTLYDPRVQLTIDSYVTEIWNLSYIDTMKPFLLGAPFTHLNLQCSDTPIDLLIEIVHLLPHLRSLEISSLPLVEVNNLSAEETDMLLLVSITNEITRVKLDDLTAIEQVHFLMNLCPRMRCLELGFVNENDLERLLIFISMNNTTYIPFLCCLCLSARVGHENVIRKLNNIIDFESLFYSDRAFRDYSIRRVGDKIFLTWTI